MAQPVARLLATGRQLGETGRTQAVQLGTDLVERGRLATDQISAVVDELVNRGGRGRIEDLRQTVRAEVQRELRTLRQSLNEDLAKIESAMDRIAGVVNDVASPRRGQVEELRDAVRDEVQRQMSTLGLATREDLATLDNTTRDDLAALENRLERQDTSSATGSEDGARHAAAMQLTPPHQRARSSNRQPAERGALVGSSYRAFHGRRRARAPYSTVPSLAADCNGVMAVALESFLQSFEALHRKCLGEPGFRAGGGFCTRRPVAS